MTINLNSDWSALTAPQALAQFAPTAQAALNNLIATTGSIDGQPRLGVLIRELCAETLGLTPVDAGAANSTNTSGLTSGEQTALAFAEQFSIDVSSIDEEMRAGFLQALGGVAFAAAMSMYIADFTPRLRRVLEQLFQPAADGWPIVQNKAQDFNPAFQEFIRVVYNMKGLDPVLTELVRLRGARLHQCRLCKSLRAQGALAAGADENVFEAIDNYADSEFSARQKAALALTDAIVWQPAHIPAQVIADIRAHFTPAEAVELVLDVMRNAANKSAVAMAADAPISDSVQVYDIDEAGNMHFGETVALSA
jgi:AhpD family alkylhydroperoxidase